MTLATGTLPCCDGKARSPGTCTRNASGSRSGLRIVGGHVPEDGDPALTSTVALVHAPNGKAFCSGTVIAPRLVVTAAHCIQSAAVGSFEVLFARSDTTPGAETRSVTRIHSMKPDGRFSQNFDLAWLELAGDVPTPYAPVEILRDPARLGEAGASNAVDRTEDLW